MPISVFLAHRKDTDDNTIDQWCMEVAEAARAKALNVQVHSGRDVFHQFAKMKGGFSRWGTWIARGGDAVQRFNNIVVPDLILGRATADIVREALRVGTSVTYWDPDTKEFASVADVTTIDDQNWKNGWRLELSN